MKLDLVIPSKNRKDKLETCLNSIFHSNFLGQVEVYLYFSIKGESTYFRKITKGISWIHIRDLESYRVPEFWNTHLKNMTADGLCYLNDDIELFPETLTIIQDNFNNTFPDYDGVMGLNQVNINSPSKVEGAFGVIGSKYADRFPDRQVFCPDYNRFFGDYEIWRYSKSIDKFLFCSTAQLLHHHPITNKKLEDATHRDVRTWLDEDRATFNERKRRDLLWGCSWELIK